MVQRNPVMTEGHLDISSLPHSTGTEHQGGLSVHIDFFVSPYLCLQIVFHCLTLCLVSRLPQPLFQSSPLASVLEVQSSPVQMLLAPAVKMQPDPSLLDQQGDT